MSDDMIDRITHDALLAHAERLWAVPWRLPELAVPAGTEGGKVQCTRCNKQGCRGNCS